MNRRNAIKLLTIFPVSLALSRRNLLSLGKSSHISKFDSIVESFKGNENLLKNIGNLTGDIGKKFIGTPYVGGTLESSDGKEKCTVILTGLDCVTFYETSLGLARILQKQEYNFSDLVDEVKFTRYRNGVLDGYTSRLHYTSDWIYDNVEKKVVTDITKKLGGTPHKFNVDFMSKHPQFYPELKNNEKNIQKIKQIEREISKRTSYIIPYNEVAAIENDLQTGDIIALTSNVNGLDYAHTGLIYKENGTAHFLHASSSAKEVKMDVSISKYIQRVGKKQSISVLRPLNSILSFD